MNMNSNNKLMLDMKLKNIKDKIGNLFLFDYNLSDDQTVMYIYPFVYNNRLESDLISSINDIQKVETTSEYKTEIFDEIIYTTNNIKNWSEMIGIIKGIAACLGYKIIISDLYECEKEDYIKVEIFD